MFTIHSTQDKALIRKAILSPNNLSWAFEVCPDVATWVPTIRQGINYIACYDEDQFRGIVVVVQRTDIQCESHIAFLPGAYGKTVAIGRACVQWIWDNTPYSEIVAPCIHENRLAAQFLTRVGFINCGPIGQTRIKDGIPYHMDLYKQTGIILGRI